MNSAFILFSMLFIGSCGAVHAQESSTDQSAADAALTPPGKSLAQMHASLLERIKFGYEAYGSGPRMNAYLHRASDEQLRTMARDGDAGAAVLLWQRLSGDDLDTSRMPDAEEIALEQARLIGHTYLVHLTAQRYLDVEPQKAAAWYRLCERLRDPVCAFRFQRVSKIAGLNLDTAERDADSLMARVSP